MTRRKAVHDETRVKNHNIQDYPLRCRGDSLRIGLFCMGIEPIKYL